LYGGNTGKSNGYYYSDTWSLDQALFYHREGIYESVQLDLNLETNFKNLKWTGDTPAGTDIKLQLRSAITMAGLTVEKFIGPDGTTNSYYRLDGELIWSGHRGDRWIQYRVYLTSQDGSATPVFYDITITYNLLPISTLLNPANNTATSNNKPTFMWSFSDSDSTQQDAFQIQIDDQMNFNDIDFDSGELSSTEQSWQFPEGTSYTALPDSILYWRVRSKDNDGDWSEYSDPYVLIIDTQSPNSNIQVPIEGDYYRSLDNISGSAFDNEVGTGVDKVEIAIERLSDHSFWDGSTWFKTETWLMVNGTTSWTYNSTSVSWESKEQYKVHSRAVDNVTNIEVPGVGLTITIDKISPESTIDYPQDNIWYKEVDIITGSSGDFNGSGLKRVDIKIKRTSDGKYWDGTNWRINENWVIADGTNSWSYDTSHMKWISDRTYTIWSRAVDNIDNFEIEHAQITFLFDNKPPESLSLVINQGDISTKDLNVNLALNATDTGSGLYLMSFSTDGREWSDWENYSESKQFLLTPEYGEKWISFRVMDHAGNIESSDPISINLIPAVSDGDKADEEEQDKSTKTQTTILGLISIVVIIILIVILTATIRRSKRLLEGYPFSVDNKLRKVRRDILTGEDVDELNLSHAEINELLEKKRQAGNISEENYDFIKKDILCSEEEKLDGNESDRGSVK
jgi:hypothetical protein